jgi:cyclophilin family peptidyl-prolyl cis-trans isomerase
MSLRHVAALSFAAVVAMLSSSARSTIAQVPSAEILTCGEDRTVGVIPVRWETVVLAGDGRLFSPCPDLPPPPLMHPVEHREMRERVVLYQAAASTDPEIRSRFIQARSRLEGAGVFASAIGMFGNLVETGGDGVARTATVPGCTTEIRFNGSERWNPGLMFRLLRDPLITIREAAAIGLQILLGEEKYSGDVARFALDEIESCIRWQMYRATSDSTLRVNGLLIEALGIVNYGNDADRAKAEQLLVTYSRMRSSEILAAVRGLEALIRQAPQRPIGQDTRFRLRELTTYGSRLSDTPPNPLDPRIRRLAFMALQAARDDDTTTLERAVIDTDWQVRRLIVQRLNLSIPEHARIADRLADDPAFQVRYDLLSPLSRDVSRTQSCAEIAKYLDDSSPLVSMRAMDVLSPSCTDLDDVIPRLVKLAEEIEAGGSRIQWHRPPRALAALARLKPEEAAKRLPFAVKHEIWQVRAAAAGIALTLRSLSDLDTLSQDTVPNVRTAALRAMVNAKHSRLVDAAIDALKTASDHQLVLTAVSALPRSPADQKQAIIEALFISLRRLTRLAEDPSRDPRVAILERLGGLLPRDRAPEFQPWIGDFDPEVSAAALKAYYATGMNVPPPLERKRRYPLQPTVQALARLPSEMIMQLDDGEVVITLMPELAPVTVATVTALVGSGYYIGKTFHRIVPNFVVQGGSPGANEYAGAPRFMRDELSAAPHVRGAVGISTRGRDTGDAQIFIDLVDLPRLDRNYTVFGYVKSGMEHVDRMLEGAVIKRVTVK